MTAVAKVERTEIAPADMGTSLLAIIANAAANPNVDIDKMERLLQMQERVQARDAKMAYTASLAKMQPLLPVITEHGKIENRDRETKRVTHTTGYALWEDINDAIKPLLHEHGFALSFKTRRTGEEVIVTGILSHIEGHSEETELSLPADKSGFKNVVQAVGSSTSYGKRYTAMALLNITSRGEDDNGQAGGGKAAHRLSMEDEPAGQGKRLNMPEPYDTVAKLKEKATKIKEALIAAPDAAAVERIVSENEAVNAQIEKYKPDWWLNSDYGLTRYIEEARKRTALPSGPEADLKADFPDSTDGFRELIAGARECEDGDALDKWFKANQSKLYRLDEAEQASVRHQVAEHRKALGGDE